MKRRRAIVRDTDRSRNLEIRVEDSVSVDEMEVTLISVAETMGLAISKITRLGAVRYPGNRHWHLKRSPTERGCLDVTYWPDGPSMWVTMRNSEPDWVHDLGRGLAAAVQDRLQHSC